MIEPQEAPTVVGGVSLSAKQLASLVSRFRAKVDTSGGPDACHPWRAARTPGGYGQLSVAGRGTRQLAHRVAFELGGGKVDKGQSVLHSCDNPPCCNRAHLRAGTPAENAADKVERGRQQRGNEHPQAKLDAAAVSAIRRALAEGSRRADVARDFGVSRRAVSHVATGSTWAHLAGGAPIVAPPRAFNAPRAKISHAVAEQIRAALACGLSQRRVAKDFGLSQAAIGAIARGESWKRAA